MERISSNPYRVLGVLANSTTKEITSSRNKIIAHINANIDIESDYDFPVLGALNRNLNIVNVANSKINLDIEKVHNAIFWFYKGNHTDNPAFESLKDGNLEDATEIWSKVASSNIISLNNFSAFLNLSTLKLSQAINGTLDQSILKEALRLKLLFLESDFVKEFIDNVAGHNVKIDKVDLQKEFIIQVEKETSNRKFNILRFLEIINGFDFSAKSDILKTYIKHPVEDTKSKVEATRASRKSNASIAIRYGKKLFEDTKESLLLIKSVTGNQDIRYTKIADDVADEILSCAIDYFIANRDSNTIDPSSEALSLMKVAKSLGVGSLINQRSNENIENLQEWISDKPLRDKHKVIEKDIKAIIAIIDEFDSRLETIANAKLIINKSQNYLINIKNALGNTDDLYLKLSTRIAQQAQHNIIEEVNEAQSNAEKTIRFDRYGTINTLKTVLSNAWYATTLIGSLDMEYDFKVNRYNKNKASLRELCNSLDINTSGSSSSVSTSSGSYGRTAASSTSGSNRTSSTSSSQSNSNEVPAWLKLVAIVFILFLLAKACE